MVVGNDDAVKEGMDTTDDESAEDQVETVDLETTTLVTPGEDVCCSRTNFVSNTESKQRSPSQDQALQASEIPAGTEETGYTKEEALALIAEGRLDPVEDSSSSTSSSSSAKDTIGQNLPLATPTPAPAPITRTHHEILDRIDELTQDIEIIKTVSHIEKNENVTDELYVKFWQSLLSDCENVRKVTIPVKWVHMVDARVFKRLEVMTIKRNDDYA